MLASCSTPAETSPDSASAPQKEIKEDSLAWINKQILENPKNPELYMAKARYFKSKGDVGKAVEEIDRALTLDSVNVSFLVFKADAYYDSKQMILAKETYLKVLDLDEKNIHSNVKLAWISLIAGLHEACFVYANNALKEDPFLPEPYYLKGLAYKELGNFKLAVSNFRTATEQDNDYLNAWLQLGYLYDTAEDTLAGEFYENALRIDSNNKDALYAFGVHLQQWSFSEEAIEQYQHLIRVDRDYHNAYYNIGYIYLTQIHEYDSAIKYYDIVLTLNPYNYKGYYNRGLAFERKNLYPKALADYDKSLELKPDYDLPAKGKSRLLNN
jgi:tetratricopeptide (TPR) repeat protein